ncbi:bifunctional 4-hydroxy-2-oxoglutarate aldolase/2-dehydro-3-deoxy-phosphogluconate aldolase [Salinispira pacifica]
MSRAPGAVFELIEQVGVVPVVRIEKPDHAAPLARALREGDLPLVEITFRTDAALRSIEAIAKEEPSVLLGAGTVLSATQAGEAVQAGAQFIVSPGLNPAVVEYCLRNDIPVVPGVNSPTQIERALEMGLVYLKFFPAEASGGLEMLKAMAAPYRAVRFVPTGGITIHNLRSYLEFPRVLACGGSWLTPGDAVERADFARVTQLAREAVAAVLGFRVCGLRVGGDDANGEARLSRIDRLFHSFPESAGFRLAWAAAKGPSANESAPVVTVETLDMERAVAYFRRNGVEVRGYNPRSGMGSGRGSRRPDGGPVGLLFDTAGITFELVPRHSDGPA